MKKLICVLLVVFLIAAAAAAGYGFGKGHEEEDLGPVEVENPTQAAAPETDPPQTEVPETDPPQTEVPAQTEVPEEELTEDIIALKRIARAGYTVRPEESWKYHPYLSFYRIQPDGHGLAIVDSADVDMSSLTYVTLYETADGGNSWTMLDGPVQVNKGICETVYMGEVVLIAAENAKAGYGTVMISYDRGHTWGEYLGFDDMFSYDSETYLNLVPHIINYNTETGIITFGWTLRYDEQIDSETYVLINQFDVMACRVVEEIYRHPDFPEAP